MVKGDFDTVAARFNTKMREALSTDRLRTTWTTLEGQVGTFQKQSGATTSQQNGLDIVVIACAFANATLDVRITYDADDKIAGLFIVPHAASMDK